MFKRDKIYSTKNIFIAYIETINVDTYPNEKIIQSVLAFKQIKSNDKKLLVPIDQYFPYYNIIKTFPISAKMKRVNPFISDHEIQMIVENEKYIQMQQRVQPLQIKKEQQLPRENSQITISEQFEHIQNQENEKIKKLVA